MIVGFTGKLGSGKDTAALRFADMVALDSQRVSFAAALKESSSALLDVPVENWETWKNDPDVKILLMEGWADTELSEGDVSIEVQAPRIIREFTAREFLQRYGTEAHREQFGYDFWVEQAVKKIDPLALATT